MDPTVQRYLSRSWKINQSRSDWRGISIYHFRIGLYIREPNTQNVQWHCTCADSRLLFPYSDGSDAIRCLLKRAALMVGTQTVANHAANRHREPLRSAFSFKDPILRIKRVREATGSEFNSWGAILQSRSSVLYGVYYFQHRRMNVAEVHRFTRQNKPPYTFFDWRQPASSLTQYLVRSWIGFRISDFCSVSDTWRLLIWAKWFILLGSEKCNSGRWGREQFKYA